MSELSAAPATVPPRRTAPVLWAAPALVLAAIPLFTNDYVQYVVNLTIVYALVAVAFNVVLGHLGQLAFANAAFFGIGAYTMAILTSHFAVPYWAALLPVGVAGGLAGAVVALPALRLKRYYLAIVTLVFGELMRWLYIHNDAWTGGSSGIALPPVAMPGFVLETDKAKYYLVLGVTAVMIWATANLLRSKVGRAWVCIRENELAAASLGIVPAHHKIVAFAWSGVVAAIAGALFASLLGRIGPESFNLHQMLVQFAIVMIGGLGSLLGAVLGAILLTAAPELLRNLPGMEEIVFSLLLIGVLLFMPRGLAGLLVERFPALRERFSRR